MLKIIRLKSVTVVIIGKKIYSTIPERGYKSFIKLEGVTYFETKRKTLTDLGFNDFEKVEMTSVLELFIAKKLSIKKCA
jgi:hypothetical protein